MIEDSGWRERLRRRIDRDEPGVPWHLEDKLECLQWCHENGIATVEPTVVLNDVEHLDLSILPDSFVLKPSHESSTRGVMVLQRDGDGYTDLLHRRQYSADSVRDELANYLGAGQKLIVEPRIVDVGKFPIPRDFKAYAFGGRVEIMIEIDRNTSPFSLTFFDGTFEPLRRDLIYANPSHVRLTYKPRPTRWADLLAAASKVSQAVPGPFARIDLYNTPRGVLLGEITLTPGSPYYGVHYKFSDELDARLGRAWEVAKRRAKV